jgi:hypothetical protein
MVGALNFQTDWPFGAVEPELHAYSDSETPSRDWFEFGLRFNNFIDTRAI